MMHVIARGGLLANLVPGLDHQDHPLLTLVAKGTWAFGDGRLRPVAEDQRLPFQPGPLHAGEPASTSLCWAGDGAPQIPGTDVVVLGEALSLRPVPQVLASIQVGSVQQSLLLHGTRRWEQGLFGWKQTPAQAALRFPLGWEHAVGGVDKKRRACPRNPIGRGWAVPIAHGELPSIDDPRAPYAAPGDRPEPINTGFVAPAWQPRLGFAGTYDDAWSTQRAPLLPVNFDPRFHRVAAGPLALQAPLPPGAPVQLSGFTAFGRESFALPAGSPRGILRLQGRDVPAPMTLATLAIMPADGLVVMTWKATVRAEATDCAIAWVLWDGPQP